MQTRKVPGQELSIHDLTRRSTPTHFRLYRMSPSFNSRPHKEVDTSCQVCVVHTHPFQFTTSQGGRRRVKSCPPLVNTLSIHDLTRRSTVSVLRRCTFFVPFNSRPHKEVDQQCILNRIHHVNFQFTTSQGGRLPPVCRVMQGYDLSIHDLTRRSTV